MKNTSDSVIYVKFDGSQTPLTVDNGYPLSVNEALFLHDDSSAASDAALNDFCSEIWGIHASTGEVKMLRMQSF